MRQHSRHDRMMRTETLENREGLPTAETTAAMVGRANYAAAESPRSCPACGFIGSRVRTLPRILDTAGTVIRYRICGSCQRAFKTTTDTGATHAAVV